jgi:uncharacterized DUF497 family protein
MNGMNGSGQRTWKSEEPRFDDYAEFEGVLVALVYTLRNDAARLISLRPAKRKERRAYDAALKNR